MKKLWLDMDGVLVDLDHEIKKWIIEHPEINHIYKGNHDRVPGIFRFPKPIEGAVESVHQLFESGKYDMYIATSVPWGNPEASTDKRYWIEKHFGRIFHKRITMTHQKNLLIGDYLVDDRTKNGADEFNGKFIQFGSEEFPDWNSVINYLL